MKRFLPDRITTQIGLLLVLCVILFHIAVTTIFLVLAPGRAPGDPSIDAAATAIALLDATPHERRAPLFAALAQANTPFRLVPDVAERPASGAAGVAGYIRERVRPSVSVGAAGGGAGRDLHVVLHDGQRLDVLLQPPDPRATGVLLISVGFVAVSLMIFSFWAAASLTRPLSRFADAAESFSFDADPARLDEGGPREVKAAARAFNKMQVRVAAMAAAQGRMLAAISHDLRTPITRMRLRAEFIADEDMRARMLRDLEQMDGMVHACLSYLRGGARRAFEPVDVSSLMQTVADQFSEAHAKVAFRGGPRLNVDGNPDDLLRAIGNLADNAIKFTGSAELSIIKDEGHAVLEVADEGDGIPHAARARMLEPFERGNELRQTTGTDGYGLGLAITRAIAEAHGGALIFADRPNGGFAARLVLPVRA